MTVEVNGRLIKVEGSIPDFEGMEKEIIDGDFVEGGLVTVRIDGKVYSRRVRYSKNTYADLYIMIDGYAFTLSDFYEKPLYSVSEE